MGERARTLALVVCLLLLATLLAGLSAGLGTSAAKTSIAKVPSTGTLLVKAFMTQNANVSLLVVPISGANVSISVASSGFHIPLVFQTNSSGEFEIPLATGAYAVSVYDSQFQKGTSVVVQENMTTEVDATATRHSHPTLFSDLPDPDSSGSVAPWSYVSVAVNSSEDIPLNDSLFMDGSYSGIVTFISTATGNHSPDSGTGQTEFAISMATTAHSEAPVRLVSSNLDPSANAHVLWLTLQPEVFFYISGLSSLSLATYTAALQVTIHAN